MAGRIGGRAHGGWLGSYQFYTLRRRLLWHHDTIEESAVRVLTGEVYHLSWSTPSAFYSGGYLRTMTTTWAEGCVSLEAVPLISLSVRSIPAQETQRYSADGFRRISMPSLAVQRDPDTGAWLLEVDTAEAAQMVADARGFEVVDEPDTDPAIDANVDATDADADTDPAAIMQAVVERLVVEQGYSEAAARRRAGYWGRGRAAAAGANMPSTAYRAS